MTGGHTDHMLRIASRCHHSSQCQCFPAGRAGAIDSKQRNIVSGDTKGSGNALPQEITGEEIRHILRFPSGLFHDHVDCVLLEITFRLFPGLTAEEIILSHHVEQGA